MVHAVAVRVGVLVGPPGVFVRTGVLVMVPGGLVGVLVRTGLLVGVMVAGPVVLVAVGVLVLAQGTAGRKISMVLVEAVGAYPPAIQMVLPSVSAGKFLRAARNGVPTLQLLVPGL